MTHDEFCEYLRTLCEQAGGQTAWARKHGIHSTLVYDVIHKRRLPGPGLCETAGVVREVVYRQINRSD